MAGSSAVSELLRANLENVTVPDSYELLREKLMNIKPTREPPTIKESPENSRPVGSDESGSVANSPTIEVEGDRG
jgi:hypothetical protein